MLICQLLMYAALAAVFSSCTSIYNFTIEIRQPAEITFPAEVSRVVLVNNMASPEDSSFGTECFINKKQVDNPFTINFDSVFQTSVAALAYGIKSEKFFSQVMVSRVPLRKDHVTLEVKPISEQAAQMIYDAANADAIISLDRCLFKYKQEISQLATGYSYDPYYTFVNTKTAVSLTCSAYLKGREKAMTTFSLQDSLFFNSQVDNDSVELYRVIPEVMINEAAGYIGEKAIAYFVPSWKKVDRYLYTAYNSRMKEALAYARTDKWAIAGNIWQELFNSKNSLKTRAFLACNLAVACELQDDLDKALEWVEKAETLFRQDNEKKNETEINRIKSYSSSLSERKIKDLLLNKQFGFE